MAMFNCLLASCLDKTRLEDTIDPGDLLEAHIFEKMRFQGNMKEFHLCVEHNDVDMRTIRTNAQKFCNKFGISYFETE